MIRRMRQQCARNAPTEMRPWMLYLCCILIHGPESPYRVMNNSSVCKDDNSLALLPCCLASWFLLSPIPAWHQYNTYASRTLSASVIMNRIPPASSYLSLTSHNSHSPSPGTPSVSLVSICMDVGILRASSAYFRTMTMVVVEVGEVLSLPLTRPRPVEIDKPQTTDLRRLP